MKPHRTIAIVLCLTMSLCSLAGCSEESQNPVSTENVSENDQTRVGFGAEFEPKGNYILHGSEAQNESDFQGYMEVMGGDLTPASTMAYLSPHQDYAHSEPEFLSGGKKPVPGFTASVL